MNKTQQIACAKYFFPHLGLKYALLAVQDSLRGHGIAYEQFNLDLA